MLHYFVLQTLNQKGLPIKRVIPFWANASSADIVWIWLQAGQAVDFA